MRTWIEIDKQALLHNLGQFLDLIGHEVILMAVVKANAYGHGLKEISLILSEFCSNNALIWFGVDSIDEALFLRRQGIAAPILTLGYVPLDRLSDAIENDIRLTVYNYETVEALRKIKGAAEEASPRVAPAAEVWPQGAAPIKIHIKVETGTSRQGVPNEEVLDFVKFIQQYHQLEIEGISTHFANIEDTTNHAFAQGQLDAFKAVLERLKGIGVDIPIKHTACSAAAILFPETRFNLVRMGISMYGLWSSKETFVSVAKREAAERDQVSTGETWSRGAAGNFILHPVLSWKSIIAQIKKIKAGAPVSYGLTERVSRDSRVAVVPVGYYDGYDRKLSSVGNVLINGKRCKVLGRVCMNMMVVDVTDAPEAKLEDEVVLLGKQGQEQISAEELAQKIGTINYEVVTRVNQLLPRVVV
ncbi:MAG: alanine racemase [bacterium]|nr:alanine racemase [bacterium]